MTPVASQIMDRTKDLLEGYSTSVDRAIPTGRFKYAKIPLELCYPNANRAPYPFLITFPSGEEESPSTTSATYVHDQANMEISIGYAVDMRNMLNTEKTILDDLAEIRRTFRDPQSFYGVSQFQNIQDRGWSQEDVVLEGSEGDFVGLMRLVSMSFEIYYREDHS